MSDVFDLRARVSADATPFNKAMDSSATSVSSALSAISSAASMFIGSGVVSAFSKATNAAYEFGQVMADISSISDVGIQQLSKNIKQLDNVYGSMSSVGNSIYNIISSGFDRSNDELIEIVKNVGQASKSIRADLYSTANVFTTVANAYNLTANDFGKIADLMFVTVKEGKAEGNELARTLGLAVNTASEAGLSFAEMSAVISTLSRTQTTSQAMIGFNQMLNAMIKPSKEAADTAAQFGIEFGAAALKSKGFTAIIKDMHDKLQGNVEAINKISGPIRAMRAVISLTGKQYENFIDILEKAEAQIGTGVAMEAFAKQTATAQQALENLKVQIDKTFIGVGQDLEPITRNLSEFAEIFLKTFGSGEGLSLGGLGRAGAYISGIGLVIKGVVSSVKLLKNFSASMVRDGNSLTSSSNTFASNVERAQRALQMSAASIADINTRMSASVLPNQHRMEQRALHPSPAMIREQAQANINAMYLRNSKGALYDPSTGRLVSERKVLAAESARLAEAYKLEREKILKQVHRDSALQRYNRRFGTKYGSYDDLSDTGKTRRGWKVLGAKVSKVSKGLAALGTGLLNVSMMVASWETGWAIGKSIGEKLKVAEWRITQWIADLTVGKTPGSTSEQEEELRKYNLKVMKKSTQAMADRLLNTGKMSEAEHASISAEIELAKATEALAKLRNKMAGKDIPKEEPKPVKTEAEVEAENRKNRAEALQKVSLGQYTVSKSSGLQDKIKAVIDKYDLPETVKSILFKQFTGENWNKKAIVTGKSAYDMKMAELETERSDRNTWGPFSKTKRRYNDIVRDIEDLKRVGIKPYNKMIEDISNEAAALRRIEASATIQKRYNATMYASIKSEAKNTLDTASQRFEQNRTATTNAEKYRKTDLDIVALSEETAREGRANRIVFNRASRNYARRFDDYIEQQTFLQEYEEKLRKSGLKDADISEVTSTFKSNLELFAKNLESERRSLIELAEQQAELPKLIAEQGFEEANALGIDIGSEKFLRDRVKSYDSASTKILGVYLGETQLQQDLRLRRSRAYQEVADEAFNELMKSRESVRQNKVSAGIMTESMAIRGNIEDLQETIKRIKDSMATFESLRRVAPKDSVEYTYYSNRVADAQGKLTDASIKLRGEFNQLADKSNEVRKGLMDAMRSFTDKDNRLSIDTLTKMGGRWTYGAAGRMNNNALWHSVNLASRMGGMVRSQPYMVNTYNAPNRQKASQMRRQAQGAVSASVDAWIMSQKYAEANVGKTVTDIFTFMKQNNTIVVRNK